MQGPVPYRKHRPWIDRGTRSITFPRIESLAIFATRNFTTRLAGIFDWLTGLRIPAHARLPIGKHQLPMPGTTNAFFASR